MPFIFLYHLHVLIFPMVNTRAGMDPLCTEQVNKIYVYFFKLVTFIVRLGRVLALLVFRGTCVCVFAASRHQGLCIWSALTVVPALLFLSAPVKILAAPRRKEAINEF